MVRTWNYPKRRASTKKRKAYRKRKYIRKRAVARPSLDNHYYKRWGQSVPYNWTANSSLDNVYVPSLDKVLSYTEFTGLYDQYRILKVVMKIRLLNNPDATDMPNSLLENHTNVYPRIWYCPDYDDAVATNWTALRERAKTKCKILAPNKQVTIVFRPAVNVQLYRTNLTTGYSPKWKAWIDCDQTDVPHYGMKWSIEMGGFVPLTDASQNYPYSFQFDAIYYLQCRGTR